MRLYHVSENGSIETFAPRTSPSQYKNLNQPVVFAIAETLLHNYLVPRECPRVTYYANKNTTNNDRLKYLGNYTAMVVVENQWLPTILSTPLYVYELPSTTFTLLDSTAGYFISPKAVKPLSVIEIIPAYSTFEKRNVGLKAIENLEALAQAVCKSTLQFSIIRMRNARKL